MKKKLCLALSVLMVMLTLLSPMAVWAEKEDGTDKGTEVTEVEKDNPADNGSSKDKSSENDSTKDKTGTKNSTKDSKTSANSRNNYSGTNGNNYGNSTSGSIQKDEISILFTSDIHSHIDTKNKGLARLSTLFKSVSASYKDDSFVLDAGDFSMGTGYQAIFESSASELRMLAYLGYDAITLGSHEFDYGIGALANMLGEAKDGIRKDGNDCPKLLASNINWEKSTGEDADNLNKALEDYGYEQEYKVIKKNNIKIAVFGLMNSSNAKSLKESGIAFDDQAERAKAIIEKINKKEKNVKLIVCLSNSGIYDEDKLDDVKLAKEVPEIDLIISGHNHEALKEPIKEGNTLIASAGCYAGYAGHISYKLDADTKEYVLDKYELLKNKSSVAEDYTVLAAINTFKGIVNSKVFGKYGLSIDQVVANSSFEFISADELGIKQCEEPLGNLISDAFIYAVKKAEKGDYEKVDVAVVPKRLIKETIHKGDITVSDVYNIMPEGTALASFYVTGKELKAIAEIDATLSDSDINKRLYISGMSYTINTHRIKLNRAFDIKLGNGDDPKEIDDEKLYRVVTDYDSLAAIKTVGDESKGVISITPKDKDGNIVIDYEGCILEKNKEEIKTWYALATYLKKMGKVSSKYEDPQGRKIVSDAKSLSEILCQPNKIGWVVRLAVLIPLVIIILILIIIFVRKNRRQANMMFAVSDRQKKAIFAAPKKQKNLFSNNKRRDRRSRINRKRGRF